MLLVSKSLRNILVRNNLIKEARYFIDSTWNLFSISNSLLLIKNNAITWNINCLLKQIYLLSSFSLREEQITVGNKQLKQQELLAKIYFLDLMSL